MNPIPPAALSSATATSSGATAALRRTPPAASAAAASAGGTSAGAAEQVSISAAGQMLAAAGAQNTPETVGDERIAALQAAIQSGRYVIDPQRIARGLLQDSQSLLAASRPAAKTGSAR